MPIIKTVLPENATGELAELYKEILELRGRVGNNAILFSSSPAIVKHQFEFVKYYFTHPTLPQPLLASIRVLISQDAACEFCIDFNTGMLINRFEWSKEQVDAMKQNPEDANLNEKEKALLLFVLKGMSDPHAVNEADIESLRELGWSDGDILDAMNHATRMKATDTLFNVFKIEKDF